MSENTINRYLLGVVTISFFCIASAAGEPFEQQDGDRVVLLASEILEQRGRFNE